MATRKQAAVSGAAALALLGAGTAALVATNNDSDGETAVATAAIQAEQRQSDVITFKASLAEVFPGEYLTVAWRADQAEECELALPSGVTSIGIDNETSGQMQVGPVNADSTFTVQCDQDFSDVFVRVVPRPAGRRVGVFDVGCHYSHSLKDDPIVAPNNPGYSHLHDFFGNETTDAFSTATSLLAAVRANPRATKCSEHGNDFQSRPARDGSGRWMPALLRNGKQYFPTQTRVYYRSETNALARPIPPGFQMLAGDPSWTLAEARRFKAARWYCGSFGNPKGEDGLEGLPSDCDGRNGINVQLSFGNCWDGVHLGHEKADDGHPHPPGFPAAHLHDHRAHVFNAKGRDDVRGCPRQLVQDTDPDDHVDMSTDRPYPFNIPRLLALTQYNRGKPNDNRRVSLEDDWALASGPLHTYHGDYQIAWDQFRLDQLTHLCLNAEQDCKTHQPDGSVGPVEAP